MLRIVSAIFLLILLLATIWLLPAQATLVLAVVASALAAAEVAGLARAIGAGVPAGFVGLAAALVTLAFAASCWTTVVPSAEILAVTMMALVVASGVVALALWRPGPEMIARVGVMVMAPIYVGLPLGVFAIVQTSMGPATTTWLLAIIAVSDSAQYYSGRTFGRTKLAPAVSPAKTVEGAVGGLVVVAIVGALTGAYGVPGLSAVAAAALAVILAVVGILGDLFESLLKRSAGVKDSSTLIPGHGGVLDRIDSHLFAAPAFCLFMRFFA